MLAVARLFEPEIKALNAHAPRPRLSGAGASNRAELRVNHGVLHGNLSPSGKANVKMWWQAVSPCWQGLLAQGSGNGPLPTRNDLPASTAEPCLRKLPCDPNMIGIAISERSAKDRPRSAIWRAPSNPQSLDHSRFFPPCPKVYS